MKAKIEMVPAMEEGSDREEFGVFVEFTWSETGGGANPYIELIYQTERKDQAEAVAQQINDGYDIEGAISIVDLM